MSISCAPTLESTSSRNSIVPCWLVVFGNRARWLLIKFYLWDNNKLQAARGISWELVVISWRRSFTVRLTESGPKSRVHSKPSLETEKVILLHCRFKAFEVRMEMNFWLTVSTNGESTRFCHKRKSFSFFGSISAVLVCDRRRNFFEVGKGFSFSQSQLVFMAKLCVPTPPYHIMVGFWSLREYSKRGSRPCTFYSRRNSTFRWWKCKHTFHFYKSDNTNLKQSLVLCCPHTILSSRFG